MTKNLSYALLAGLCAVFLQGEATAHKENIPAFPSPPNVTSKWQLGACNGGKVEFVKARTPYDGFGGSLPIEKRDYWLAELSIPKGVDATAGIQLSVKNATPQTGH